MPWKKEDLEKWRKISIVIFIGCGAISGILLYVIFGPLLADAKYDCSTEECNVLINGSSCKIEYKEQVCDCDVENYSKKCEYEYEYAKFKVECYILNESDNKCPSDDYSICINKDLNGLLIGLSIIVAVTIFAVFMAIANIYIFTKMLKEGNYRKDEEDTVV